MLNLQKIGTSPTMQSRVVTKTLREFTHFSKIVDSYQATQALSTSNRFFNSPFPL